MFLYLAIPLIVSAVTLKGNVLVIFGVYFLLTYFHLILELSVKKVFYYF